MIDEEALLQRILKLEEQALVEIYDQFNCGLYRYAMRLTGDEALAEDCVAETFKRLLEALQRGGGPRRYLKAYLYRIAHNWITDHYRRSKPVADILDYENHPDTGLDLHVAVAQSMAGQQLHTILASLPPEQRQVIALKFLEGWENQEIAQSLNKNIGAVKSLQHRALAKLRILLDGVLD